MAMRAQQEQFGAGTAADASSQLLIHTGSELGGGVWSVRSIIRRIHARMLDGPTGIHAPLSLEILDLQGRHVLELAKASAVVDVALPPGTYHITADVAGRRRRYTVSLARGASYDLYLRPAGHRH
jgi:hypothetical protein